MDMILARVLHTESGVMVPGHYLANAASREAPHTPYL